MVLLELVLTGHSLLRIELGTHNWIPTHHPNFSKIAGAKELHSIFTQATQPQPSLRPNTSSLFMQLEAILVNQF